MKKSFTFLLLLFSFAIHGQKNNLPVINILTQNNNTSIRGLSVVNDNIVWASGSNGTIGRSTNAGRDWKWMQVKGFEKTDFRDIEAFDATTAIIMGIGEPAYILRTIDGGASWKVVFENRTKGMFLDAMEFWNEQSGIVLGDPVNGKFFIARTFDGGHTWKEIPEERKPAAENGEACFAASGTNIRILDSDEAVFISGGTRSRIFIRDQATDLPVIQGKETTGAYSVAVYDHFKRKGGQQIIVVGGDYLKDTSSIKNCFMTTNRGRTWTASKKPPAGYKSCVEYLSQKQVITCGPTGVDYSYDNGKTWKPISQEGFNVCRIAKSGSSLFLAGNNGKIGRVIFK
jgi:photosystem II stability/assembly factor-like uncharacterized protein